MLSVSFAVLIKNTNTEHTTIINDIDKNIFNDLLLSGHILHKPAILA